jgi:bifunctional glutamyl/prolyl-tRNA synthetase
LVLRFDDTNPAKEKEEFEEVILHDLKLLQVKHDHFSRTSDHFELMLTYCEKMIKEGNAYVDDTDAETMKAERESRTESKNRSNSAEKNLSMWVEMKNGSARGQTCAVRAKMNMLSDNGCMRDPTIYRCKPEPHPSTGTKYKVYPTYDFACPIVDSIEGITHALRTTEYMDRDEQFFWFIDALGLRKPHIYAYSRLSMTNTVMSKRKLAWFVDNNMVDGWDDPRFPTVRGIIRRGLTIDALKQFIIAQGSSRSVVFMEWDKIWSMNKKIIDPVAPRFTAVNEKYHVPVHIEGVVEEAVKADKHPKDPSIGQKTVWRSSTVLIDGEDAEVLKEGINATFINWGNITIKSIKKEGGKIVAIDAVPDLDNRDYKKTIKVTWLAKTPKADFVPTTCVYYDHIISKPVLDKEDDFKQFVGKDTKTEIEALGDPELSSLKKGDVIQIQRRGFFIVDSPYKPLSPNTCKATPIVLISIPDGTPGSYGPPGKAQVATKAPATAAVSAKPAKGSKKSGMPAAPAGAASNEGAKPTGINADAAAINATIANQGELVRKLKVEKAPKGDVDVHVKVLLELKARYKAATGQDWKPGCTPPAASAPAAAVTAAAAPARIGSIVGDEINNQIGFQGDKIRKLKGEKAPKGDVDVAVKVLLDLKAKYKAATGQDWKPGSTPPDVSAPGAAAPAAIGSGEEINDHIGRQGDKIRKLKGEKAEKKAIDEEVQNLLALKAKYKEATGKDWKPCTQPAGKKEKSKVPEKAAAAPTASGASTGGDANSLNDDIAKQGDLVRHLKADKASKAEITAAVAVLLDLKAKFKTATGSDWKPGQNPPAASNSSESKESTPSQSSDLEKELNDRIVAHGELVRKLKGDKADKADIDANVQILLGLKAKYKEKTGGDWKPAGNAGSAGGGGKGKKEKKPQQQPKKKEEKKADSGQKQTKTRLGVEAKKEENLSDWYSQVIVKAEMLEYYDVSGCYILRPWSYNIWEIIQKFLDAEIKKLGVENCYFPIFVSQAALEREKAHIADFAPEVAWVTKSGDSELAEPIAVRPTSETVMYPAYAKWIQSYRDLPLKLNQWNNVVVSCNAN